MNSEIMKLFYNQECVAYWLPTNNLKLWIFGSRPAATYVQMGALSSNRSANV